MQYSQSLTLSRLMLRALTVVTFVVTIFVAAIYMNSQTVGATSAGYFAAQPEQSKCEPGDSNCCNGVKTTFDLGCVSSKDDVKGNPIFGALLAVINFMAVGVGIAVVGGIIYGGVRYITANGNAGKTEEATKIIINAILGLLLFFFMYALLNWLIPGGVLN